MCACACTLGVVWLCPVGGHGVLRAGSGCNARPLFAIACHEMDRMTKHDAVLVRCLGAQQAHALSGDNSPMIDSTAPLHPGPDYSLSHLVRSSCSGYGSKLYMNRDLSPINHVSYRACRHTRLAACSSVSCLQLECSTQHPVSALCARGIMPRGSSIGMRIIQPTNSAL